MLIIGGRCNTTGTCRKLRKNTPIIVRPLEGTRPQSTCMLPLCRGRGHPDTMTLTCIRNRNNSQEPDSETRDRKQDRVR